MYEKEKIRCEIAPFFKDVKEKLGAADLVISRGGASTVAEIVVAGRPAIFVPYPYHTDQQQKMNAMNIVARNGGWLMEEGKDFTADQLQERLMQLLDNPQTLFTAAEQARKCGFPDAARRLGNLVTAVVQGWSQADDPNLEMMKGKL